MRAKVGTLLVVLFVCSFCPFSFAEVSLKSVGADKLAGFQIKHEELKEPLVIGAKESSPILYETIEDGNNVRTFVKGQPFWTKKVKGGFRGKWKDENGRVVEISIKPKGKQKYHISFKAKPDAGIMRWGFSLGASTDEYFTGCIEKAFDCTQYEGTEDNLWPKEGITEAMDLRGQSVRMLVSNSMALYSPFYYSSRGYGLFTKGTWPGKYDFCKSDDELVQISFEGPKLKMVLYAGQDPAEIISSHSRNVGPTFVPPKWAFGCWKWRNNHYNKPEYYDGTPANGRYCSQVVEDILLMEAYDIPCGVYWLDRPWATGKAGYDDFDWSPERFPNAREMISWMDSKGTKTLLWLAPWVMGNMAETATEQGYNISKQRSFPRRPPLVDFTNKKALKWWQTKGVKKVLDDGIVGFKLDRADESYPYSRDVFAADGRETRQTRNDYPVQYIKATYDACRKSLGKDFICFARAGYTGSSRYGGFWGGDIHAGEYGLRAAIIAAQRSAVMGFPIWGSDTCGYKGDFGRENSARWLAFSCFTPIFEVGPINDRGFWDMPEEPHYDKELIAIWRLYSKLRMRLIDYSYNLAKVARKTGLPPIRPMFMVYPEQKQAWAQWGTYLYGSDILVSPVWKNGVEKQSVYLPAGERWIDGWDTKKVYEGGKVVTVDASLHRIPVFVRERAEIISAFDGLEELYVKSLIIAEKKPDLKQLEKTVE